MIQRITNEKIMTKNHKAHYDLLNSVHYDIELQIWLLGQMEESMTQAFYGAPCIKTFTAEDIAEQKEKIVALHQKYSELVEGVFV